MGEPLYLIFLKSQVLLHEDQTRVKQVNCNNPCVSLQDDKQDYKRVSK